MMHNLSDLLDRVFARAHQGHGHGGHHHDHDHSKYKSFLRGRSKTDQDKPDQEQPAQGRDHGTDKADPSLEKENPAEK